MRAAFRFALAGLALLPLASAQAIDLNEQFSLILHLPGVHEYGVDAPIRIYIPTHKLFVFDAQGRLLQAPGRRVARVA